MKSFILPKKHIIQKISKYTFTKERYPDNLSFFPLYFILTFQSFGYI